ncbi:MAG: hypothetical protein EGS78_04860 [Bacteroidales bacterium]|nr:hypothetical protein [Bacteroidales bacterium]
MLKATEMTDKRIEMFCWPLYSADFYVKRISRPVKRKFGPVMYCRAVGENCSSMPKCVCPDRIPFRSFSFFSLSKNFSVKMSVSLPYLYSAGLMPSNFEPAFQNYLFAVAMSGV